TAPPDESSGRLYKFPARPDRCSSQVVRARSWTVQQSGRIDQTAGDRNMRKQVSSGAHVDVELLLVIFPGPPALELEDCQRSVSLPDEAVDRAAQQTRDSRLAVGWHHRKGHFVEAFAAL